MFSLMLLTLVMLYSLEYDDILFELIHFHSEIIFLLDTKFFFSLSLRGTSCRSKNSFRSKCVIEPADSFIHASRICFVLFGPEAKIHSLRLALFSAVLLSSRPSLIVISMFLVSLAPSQLLGNGFEFQCTPGTRKQRRENLKAFLARCRFSCTFWMHVQRLQLNLIKV